MRDFCDGTETPNTLHNICQALQRRRDSYLAQAMAQDVELVKATMEQKRSGHPDLVEFGILEALLTTIVEQNQILIGFAAGQKKPKVTKLPRPVTGEQRLRRQLAREAHDNIAAVLRFPDQQGG